LSCCASGRRPVGFPSGADAASQLTADQIEAVIGELMDMGQAISGADPEHKLRVSREYGLRLTYLPETGTVRAEVDLGAQRWSQGLQVETEVGVQGLLSGGG
jgi:hypothetical protein